MATATLDDMAAGGMYDLVGGGFHRYSVDERWLVPHFEKMLYDNAVLASAYLHAWVVTGEPRYRRDRRGDDRVRAPRARSRRRRSRSAQDADTDGVEGLTYTWTPEEAAGAGLPRELLQPFEHGRCIVRGELEPELRDRLLAIRAARPQPFRDDKALASWNGLMLAPIAEAGYRFERDDWLAAARALGDFLLGSLSDAEGRLQRSLRDGRASGPGFLDDYANVAYGLLELHVATGELRWLLEARRLALLAIELFARRRERRVLPRGRGRRRARRAHEGSPGHAHPVRERDARVGAAAAGAYLGRRRARAARGLGLPPRRARTGAGAGSVRVGTLRPRPLVRPTARDRDRGAGRRRRSRARRWRPSSRGRWSRSALPRRFRCSRASRSSRVGLRSTSASASPAARP